MGWGFVMWKLPMGWAVVVAAGLVLAGGSATADPASDVREVDWPNAEFVVPAVGPCPQQVVDFTGGAAEAGGWVYRLTPERQVEFADVTGEGVVDALILVECGPPNSEYSRALVAMTEGPQPLGTVVSPSVWTQVPDGFTVHDGEISVRIEDFDTGGSWTERYRWAQSARAFVRVDGS
ncbi:hypothetical protein LZ318_09295 [Saccharopolyspora indica]|uniref:hypothetical protein n=1 Tax=Saccharopolyspora indica TaxID=1229659 RepID=UPI0022EA5FC8|nr:hypothetical protein [Saccharopolyspora indica]MDA3643448.1 hypothetical protein [Saccharopolyspora indica]